MSLNPQADQLGANSHELMIQNECSIGERGKGYSPPCALFVIQVKVVIS
jgi:hypothetical protein